MLEIIVREISFFKCSVLTDIYSHMLHLSEIVTD